MPKRSKLIIFVPVVLLLVRNIVPAVHGQLNPAGWSLKSDRPNSPYRLQSALLTADRAFQSNPSNQYWSPNLDSFSTFPVRDVIEIPSSPLHTSGIHRQQQLPVDLYSFLKEQRHAPPPRNAPTGVEFIEPITNKMLYQQQSKKSLDEQKETPSPISGSGSAIDYPSADDENSSAQPVQPVGSYTDDFSPPSSPSKAKIKSRQVVLPNGLSRYLVFQNLKRARDGYICHFKLCQVGVSGKRLSNM